jgi:phage terminase large subunit GpA-like protein
VTKADALIAAFAKGAAPPPDHTVSEWADAERVLPATSGARGSRWQTSAVPYLRGIQDALHEPGVAAVALKKCSQVGGSEALHNIVGYHIHHAPCPILFVHPTSLVAEQWSKDRLADMIRSTAALRSVVRDKRGPKGSHESESTLTLKVFQNGFLALGGANSENSFARWSVRLAIGDDVDRWPPVIGEEGDPADLLRNRVESFFDGQVMYVSTPTLKGGRIDTLYERSDQRRYFVQCLGCARWDYLTWSDQNHFRVVFDDRDPETARLECPDVDHGGCGAHLSEADRRLMIETGEWRATAEPKEAGLVGFHLPAMLSTIGSRTLPGLVAKWLDAREKGKESMRVFINTQLAEGWEDRGARTDATALSRRKEDYGDDVDVPAGAVALTCGVDVQDNRFELQVWGWGLGEERWVIDWRSVPGDPKKDETRQALLDALSRKYRHASGAQLPIHATCIDSGFLTDEVYDFVLAYQAKRIYATKGLAGKQGDPIIVKSSGKRRGSGRPVDLYIVNVDDAKTDVMSSVGLVVPGPGYLHFPAHVDTVDDEYFAQLCSEHRETRYNKSKIATHEVWVQDRERNEALDTAVLNLAAFKRLRPNLRQFAELIALAMREPTPTDSPDAPPAMNGQPAVPEAVGPRGRRIVRSSYLSRR